MYARACCLRKINEKLLQILFLLQTAATVPHFTIERRRRLLLRQL